MRSNKTWLFKLYPCVKFRKMLNISETGMIVTFILIHLLCDKAKSWSKRNTQNGAALQWRHANQHISEIANISATVFISVNYCPNRISLLKPQTEILLAVGPKIREMPPAIELMASFLLPSVLKQLNLVLIAQGSSVETILPSWASGLI